MQKDDILRLLSVRGEDQEKLFEKARRLRERHFGNRAFVRGVVEITNACRVDCDYCQMMRSNQALNRYTVSRDVLLGAARRVRDAGINVVLIQGGENPETTGLVSETLPDIKRLGLYVLLNLGNKSRADYARFREQGADGYRMKFETANEKLHRKLRKQPFSARKRCMDALLDLGYDLSTGNIVGLPGQTLEDIADDYLFLQEYGHQFKMVSISPFIPAAETLLASESSPDINLALNAIAILRLVYPAAMIPSVSALNILDPPDPKAQVNGFLAGATNITVNFTPDDVRPDYRIYKKERSVVGMDHALNTLREAGLNWDQSAWTGGRSKVEATDG